AAGVQARELFLFEALVVEQGHCERVAHGEGGGCARGWHEVHGARLFGDAAVDEDIGGACERRVAAAGQRDELCADASNGLEQPDELFGLAAVRQGNDDIVLTHQAQVAVQRFGRVQEERRRAGARQCRGDLAADDARLAHAGDDDASAAGEQQFDGAVEAFVQTFGQCLNGLGLGREHAAGDVAGAAHERAASWMRSSRVTSASKSASASAFCASLFARAGSSCTSMNTPSTPAATPADASGTMYSACPAVSPLPPPGSCRLCVTSKTTGAPSARIIGNARMSTTRLL